MLYPLYSTDGSCVILKCFAVSHATHLKILLLHLQTAGWSSSSMWFLPRWCTDPEKSPGKTREYRRWRGRSGREWKMHLEEDKDVNHTVSSEGESEHSLKLFLRRNIWEAADFSKPNKCFQRPKRLCMDTCYGLIKQQLWPFTFWTGNAFIRPIAGSMGQFTNTWQMLNTFVICVDLIKSSTFSAQSSKPRVYKLRSGDPMGAARVC